ncbi:MAG: NADPH-dependent 7-cyano-7-deazaguanine reductase QueF [Azoarcus sp.]|jgi:7-cyano-7-deazaguanine reductase|nr:NADPH-dependent 7-cyano-7-deazaguanine reductase QueF [Azoarcus sp.]
MKPSGPFDASHSALGKQVLYRDTYAPELLFPIARQDQRSKIGLHDSALPFIGEDLWNAYELSWLDPRGKPVVALARFRVPASSPNLIESKSLKLYLNAFNQERMSGVNAVHATIANDLSAIAGEAVRVEILPLDGRLMRRIKDPEGFCLDSLDIDIDTYRLCPDVLRTSGERVTETLYTHLLKSNCPVTRQPDWGMLAVRYTGPTIERAGLLRYIVSFRQHDEFHEHCVERIFCDILERCRPTDLAVCARYTRRGGLDINPFRATPPENGREGFIDWNEFDSEIRQ